MEQKLVTKEEFVEVLKNNNVDNNLIVNYSSLPKTIMVNKDEYILNNVIKFSDNNEYELNYYCKTKFKFLLPYTSGNLKNVLLLFLNEFKNYEL